MAGPARQSRRPGRGGGIGRGGDDEHGTADFKPNLLLERRQSGRATFLLTGSEEGVIRATSLTPGTYTARIFSSSGIDEFTATLVALTPR